MITYCEWLYQLDKADRRLWGDEAVDLNKVTRSGASVLPGFMVSKEAYVEFFSTSSMRSAIERACSTVNLKKPNTVHGAAEEIRQAIMVAPLSKAFATRLAAYLRHLEAQLVRPSGSGLRISVRAGALEIAANVRKASDLERLVKSLYALTFQDKTFYRRMDENNVILHEPIAIFVAYEEQPEFSGIAYVHDPSAHDDLTVTIEAAHFKRPAEGMDVQDVYRVDRKSMTLLSRDVRKQWWADNGEGKHVSPQHLGKPTAVLSDERAVQLARQINMAQKGFNETMRFSWTYARGQFWVNWVEAYELLPEEQAEQEGTKPILVGKSGSLGCAYGPVRVIHNARDRAKLKAGDIAVVEMVHADDVEWLAGVAGLITEIGTEASAEGKLGRQMGIPAVVGISQALAHLKNGQVITVNGTLGAVYAGVVFQGFGSGEPEDGLLATSVKIMATVTDPHLVKKGELDDCDGIGLLRGEFILNLLGIHPRDVISRKIEKEYIEVLADNLEEAVRAVAPRPVIYQLHDLNSSSLMTQSRSQRSKEANPVIGYRGAHMLLQEPDVLELELKALSRLVSKELAPIAVMMPMARSIEEVEGMLKLIKASALGQESETELWVKCETPALAILAEELCALDIAGVCFDVPSIAQLITGFDKDSSKVGHHVDQANPAVEQALTYAIATCREHGVSTLLSAEMDDLRPEVIQTAIEAGLTGVTVAPQMVRSMHGLIGSIERALIVQNLLPGLAG